MSVHDKFKTTRGELASTMIEREQEIDLALTALVAQEHVLLVGPPGCGKSMMADALTEWMDGQRFSCLLTKFSTPEDVFGPISVAGLKEDKYRRITTGKLPEADVAFVDEIFKASSAILNTLLTVLNERTFRNDGVAMACPLKLCVAASNEWPGAEGGQELGALFDRFLLRKSVRPIGAEKSLHKLLWTDNLSVNLSTSITSAEVAQATEEAQGLPWSDDAREALHSIHREAKREGIVPGDRRLRKSVMAARAFAWLAGASEVEPDHLEILGHTLWDDPAEQPKKLAEIVGQIANPTGMKINSLLMEAEQVIAEANLRDLTQAAGATKKLAEIQKQLKGVSGVRAEQARDYVGSEVKRIKLATVEAL